MMEWEWLLPILRAVLGSLVRSALMMISGVLLERHLVSQQVADQFVSDGVTHVLIAVPAILALAWSIRAKIRGRVRFLTGLRSAPGTTEAQVDARVANGMGASVKAAVVLLAGILAAGSSIMLPGCAATRPPAGTYSAAGVQAFDADQALKDITALSQTAINLNAATGRWHLQDRDTALVRDFALSAGAGLLAYGQGQGSLSVVVAAFRELSTHLSAEAMLNDKLRFVLALVRDNISRIPGS